MRVIARAAPSVVEAAVADVREESRLERVEGGRRAELSFRTDEVI